MRIRPNSRILTGRNLFLSSSIMALSMLAAMPAEGQAVPADCTGSVASNGTVDCVQSVVVPIDLENLNGLTLNIGQTGSTTSITNTSQPVSPDPTGGEAILLSGTGDLTINVHEDANIYGTRSAAIRVDHTGGNGNVNINSEGSIVSQNDNGILVYNLGNGETNISVASVSSQDAAIEVFHTGTDINITSTGTLYGEAFDVVNAGTGATNINATDILNVGSSDKGIEVRTRSTATDVNITVTGDIELTDDFATGIYVYHLGTGHVDISANNFILEPVNRTGRGIRVVNRNGTGVNVSVTGTLNSGGTAALISNHSGAVNAQFNTITSRYAGVSIRNSHHGYSSGQPTDVILTITGNINARNMAVDVFNSGHATVINTGQVFSSGHHAISVNHSGTGDVDITATGTVRGEGDGIVINNTGNGNTTVNAVTVKGNTGSGFGCCYHVLHGIKIVHDGANDINISTTGSVSGQRSGIWADNEHGTGSINIQAKKVSSDNGVAIYAIAGTNAKNITISTTQLITSGDRRPTADGIRAISHNSYDVIISTSGAVTGLRHGIYSDNRGGGDTNVTVSGQVSGTYSSAINLHSVFGSNTDIVLQSGAHIQSATGQAIIESDGNANVAINDGATVIGDVRLGRGSDRISVSGGADISGVTLFGGGDDGSAADGFIDEFIITDYSDDTYTLNLASWERAVARDVSLLGIDFCSGFLTVTGTSLIADISGCSVDDRFAIRGSSLVSGDVLGGGGNDHISVLENGAIGNRILGGTGDDLVRIDTTGSVNFINTGRDADFVDLRAGTIGQVRTFTHADRLVLDGANVTNLIDTHNGADIVTVRSGFANRLFTGLGDDLVNMSGGDIGFDINTSNGHDTINMSGGSAPRIITQGGDDLINISGGTVSTQITMGTGDDRLNITGGTVSGAIRMGLGSDTVSITGGDVSGLTLLDGGDDDSAADGMIDVLNVNNATFTLASNRIRNWEEINIAGSDITFSSDEVFDRLNFTSGQSLIGGAILTEEALIEENTILGIRGGTSVSGNFENHGELHLGVDTIGGFDGSFDIGGSFNQRQDGSLSFDLNNGSQLNVAGTANLAGALNLTGFTEGETTLVSAGHLSGTFDEAGLANGLLLQQELNYDHDNGRVSLMGERFDAGTVSGLSNSQQSLANAMMDDLVGRNSRGGLSSLSLQTGSLDNHNDLSSVLSEIAPQSAASGLQSFRHSQRLFAQEIMDRSSDITEKTSWASTPIYGSSLSDTQTESFDINTGISGLGNGPVKLGIAAGFSTHQGSSSGEGLDRVQTQTFKLGAHAQMSAPKGQVDTSISYALGSTQMARHLQSDLVSLNELQTGETTTQGASITSRYSMTETDLPITPFVQAGFDHIRQSETQLGQSTAALTLKDYDGSRLSYGIGASLNENINDTGFVKLNAYALRYEGDTDIGLTSRFTRAGSSGSTFTTDTNNVRQQFILDGSAGLNLGTHTNIGIEGFSEFGDITAYGGRVKVGAKF